MAGVLLPALPWLVAAVVVGIAGALVTHRQHQETARNVIKWATVVLVCGLIFVGLIVAFIIQFTSISDIG